MNYLMSLKGKEVEVDYNGSLYKGILTDVGDEEIYLKLGDSWIALPLYEVGNIKPVSGS